jgi:high-affinity Fe2+/Pb2+ permease
MKTIQASFNQGLREGWSTFWAPFAFVVRMVAKAFRAK